MPRSHNYGVFVTWTGNRGSGTSTYRAYGRDHQVATGGADDDSEPDEAESAGDPGRPRPIDASADPAFRGDADRWNPELLLTAALAQCHMLAYLHLCAVNGVVVTGYTDRAQATMTETAGGGGHFTQAVLRPQVTVRSADMVDRALALHDDAHAACFIAASVNFPVRHEPTVASAQEGTHERA